MFPRKENRSIQVLPVRLCLLLVIFLCVCWHLAFVMIFQQNQAPKELSLQPLTGDMKRYLPKFDDDSQLKVLSKGTSVGAHYNLAFWMQQLDKVHFSRESAAIRWGSTLLDLKMQPVLQDSKKGKSFLFCTIPKVGCSRWRRLLRKAAGISNWNEFPHDPHTNGLAYVGNIANTTARQHALDDPSRIRVSIVRNPFARILSTWLQKKDEFALPQDFTRFVHAVVLSKKRLLSSQHTAPQSSFCGMRLLQYDFIGQVESIGEWGDALLQRLGLDEQADTGWGTELDQTFFEASWIGGNGMSPTTGAVSKLKQYYDAELVQMVMTYYREDILRFGYYDHYLELLDAVSVNKN